MNSRPEPTPLDRYLDRICRRLLFVSARERREMREELRQHLESLAAHAARTVPTAKAMEEAMEKFGDPKQIAKDLSRQGLRRRRWLSTFLKTAAGAALTLLTLVIGYSAYWYFALSKPMESEATPTPITSAAAPLVAIQAAQDSYSRQIRSLRFQSNQTIHEYYQGHGDKMVTHTYQVASKGDKYYSREISNNRSGYGMTQTPQDVYVSDGKTLRELTAWDNTGGSFQARRTYGVRVFLRDNKFKPHDPDEVLQYGYKVHGVWIGDMLRRGKPAVEGTVTDAEFGPLTVVRCRNTTAWGTNEAVRLWLAPNRGWVAVKTETVQADARPPFALRGLYEARKLVHKGEFWVASEGRFRYEALGLGRREEIADRPQRFANIAFNDVPDSVFIVHYPVGTQLLSEDFQKVSVLQPSGQWKEQTSFYASNPASGWPYLTAGIAAIGVGVGFVLVTRKRRGRRLTA
jgi:hypothetical protein